MAYIRCKKCSWGTYCPDELKRDNMLCGVIVMWVPAENPDAGAEDFMDCMGFKPLGCGGALEEISETEFFDGLKKN